jgi:uncharacterized membrane protein
VNQTTHPGEARPPSPHGADPVAVTAARETFSTDFRRFFLRGLAALMPTLVTLWLVMKVWEFLWQSIGVYLIIGMKRLLAASEHLGTSPDLFSQGTHLVRDPRNGPWYIQLFGVVLAVVLVYLVGLFAGNFIGRFSWRLAERAVMRVPLIRAIYPAVKQVTDFLLADKASQFAGTRVVAVEPHAKGIWSIGLVTGAGLRPLSDSLGQEMITVFVPSSPTAFSGYVLVVPRGSVIELPLTVEQAMRLLVSGGVLDAAVLGRQETMPARAKLAPGAELSGHNAGALPLGGQAVEPSPATVTSTPRELPRPVG